MKSRFASQPATHASRFPASPAHTLWATALAAALALPLAQAVPTNRYWDTNGTSSGNGNLTGIWGGTSPSAYWATASGGTSSTTTTYTSGDNAIFSAAAGVIGPSSVNLGATVSANSITFTQTTAMSLTTTSSYTIQLGAGGITVNSGSLGVTINSTANPLLLSGSQTWANQSSNDLSVGAANASGAPIVVTLNGTGTGKIHLTGVLANGAGAATTGLAVSGTTSTGFAELAGTNTFTGGSTLTAGYVAISNAAAFGGSGNTVNFNGSTIMTSAAKTLVNTSYYNTGADFTVGAGTIGSTTYSSKITLADSAAVDLKAYSAATRTITLYSGNANVTTGNAQLGFQTASIGNSPGAGTLRFAGGATTSTTTPGIVSFEGVVTFGSGVSLNIGNNAATVFSGDNRLSGNPNVSVENNGVLNLSNGSGTSSSQAIGALYGGGKVLNNSNHAGTATLTIGGATTAGLFQGTIQDSGFGNTSGKVALIVNKSSALATQTLSGPSNSYTGTTTVTSGILLVTGAHSGGGAYTVASGATLAGTGTIGSAINVSGTLSPGVSGVGTFTTGAVTFSNGSTLAIDINTTNANADLLVVNGGVSTGGSTVNLALTDLGANVALPIGTKLVLVSHSGSWSTTDVLSYGGSPVADGSTITLGNNTFTVAYADTTYGTASLTLTVNPNSTPYQSWIDGYATQLPNAADRLPDADPDGDGLTNLQEFAFDGNPAEVASKGKIAFSTSDPNAPGLSVTLAVRNNAVLGAGPDNSITLTADGIVYLIQGSESLTTYDKVITEVIPASTLTPAPESGWTARTFVISDSVGLPTRRFMRVGVSQP